MRTGHRDVVIDDRNRVRHFLDELTPTGSGSAPAQLDPNQEFSDGHGGNGNVVFVLDDLVKGSAGTVCVNKERRVEQEPAQERSSSSRRTRTDRRSLAQVRSVACLRSSALTSRPRPVLTGSSWATALPRRTMVNRSPRCSTASSMSEKLLAASVALTSVMRSDYHILDPTL